MYNKLKTDYIKEYNTEPLDVSFLNYVLKYTAMNSPFSTFGYIKGFNSSQCLDKTTGGNCVALSLYIKRLLSEHNIISFLIPASVPKMFAHKDYLTISHVALCIPFREYVYVLDPAFYFMEPMILNLTHTESVKSMNSFNIYSNVITPMNYQLKINNKKLRLNEFQTLPKDIFFVETRFVSEPSDIWHYYLVEVLNPDQAISSFYMSIKYLPFITALNSDYSIKHLVKFLDENTIIVKENGEKIYEGEPIKMSLNLLQKLLPYKLDYSLPKDIKYVDFNIV